MGAANRIGEEEQTGDVGTGGRREMMSAAAEADDGVFSQGRCEL